MIDRDQLREAIAWYDEGGMLDGPAGAFVENHLAAFAEAARLVADPDYEAAGRAFNYGEPPDDPRSVMLVRAIVDAAFGGSA